MTAITLELPESLYRRLQREAQMRQVEQTDIVRDMLQKHLPEITSTPRSILDILTEAKGHVLFDSAEAVDEYLDEERSSWD